MIHYALLKIIELNQWSVYLHKNQCYLGRVYMMPHESELLDFFDMNEALYQDFFNQGQKVKQALSHLYQPDKFNYAALGNVFPKLHVHIIPRYQAPRTHHGTLFMDDRWGQNYAPYNKQFKINEDILFKIRDDIKEALHGTL